MFKKLKTALVKSYVGALALGWLFAQAILHFAYVFSAPVAGWLTRREYQRMTDHPAAAFSLQDAAPELIKSFSMLLIGYFLLRWLYYKPLESEASESGREQKG
jgi:hypothetical protein